MCITLYSPVKAINGKTLHPFDNARCSINFMYQEGGTMYARTVGGRILTTRQSAKRQRNTCELGDAWSTDYAKALWKLGVIKEDEYQRHFELCNEKWRAEQSRNTSLNIAKDYMALCEQSGKEPMKSVLKGLGAAGAEICNPAENQKKYLQGLSYRSMRRVGISYVSPDTGRVRKGRIYSMSPAHLITEHHLYGSEPIQYSDIVEVHV